MSLDIKGQAGGRTELTADDDTFGLMTQVPNPSVHHSPGGLTDADGNSAFGVPFTLVASFSHSTTYAEQSTTCTLADENMPYKVRVLGVRVRCLANRPFDFRQGYGYVRVQVQDSDGSAVWTHILSGLEVGDMEAGEVKEVSVTNEDLAVIDEDEGLRVVMASVADSYGTNPTASFVVEVQCVRVL